MADGLLTSGLNWIDQQKQALKARFGLLADNPEEFARQLAAEQRQRAGVGLIGEPKTAEEMASGAWINSPYGRQAMEAGSGFAGTTIGKNAIAAAKETLNKPRMGVWQGEKPLDMWKAEQQARIEESIRESNKQKFLEQSVEKQLMYHGTGKVFDAFQENKRGIHFLSPSPQFANKYAGEEYSVAVGDSPNVIPAYVRALNPFDFENKKHVNAVAVKAGLTPNAIKEVKQGLWSRIEDRTIIDAIKKLGFDGLYVKENGVKNLGVFSPEQIRSKFAQFDPARIGEPDLLAAGVPLGLLAGTNVEMPKKQEKKSMTPKR